VLGKQVAQGCEGLTWNIVPCRTRLSEQALKRIQSLLDGDAKAVVCIGVEQLAQRQTFFLQAVIMLGRATTTPNRPKAMVNWPGKTAAAVCHWLWIGFWRRFVLLTCIQTLNL